jgi:Mce-associated membrane protein
MPQARSSRPAAESEDLVVPALTAKDSQTPSADDDQQPGDSCGSEHQPGTGARWRRALPVVLGALTVVVGALGGWACVEGHDLRAAAATSNGALVDASATRAVTRQVSSAVDTIFSYSYTDTSSTRSAAQALLTGPAIRQYDQLFALVESEAPKEKLVVTTRVTNIGVELLTGGRARLLVFADQQDTMTGTGKSSYGGAMFAVTAVLQGGRWRIDNIDTFTSAG